MISSGSMDDGLAMRCLCVRGTWIDCDGPSIWSSPLIVTLGDPARHCPSFSAMSMPLVREPTIGFDAKPLHLKSRAIESTLRTIPTDVLHVADFVCDAY